MFVTPLFLYNPTGHRLLRLERAGESAGVRVLFETAGREAPEFSMTVEHAAPRTSAYVTVKTVARGSSRPKFTGLLRILPGCPDSASFLRHDALLFDDARSTSLPSLEIGTDQVKCSHAATAREVAAADLFYQRSRGLGRTEAEAQLVTAFTAEVRA